MPPASALEQLPQSKEVKYEKGPSILMEAEDHYRTASHTRNTSEGKEYRANQAELLSQGKFEEAFQNDVDDIRSKFGNKYDEALRQVEEYKNSLGI